MRKQRVAGCAAVAAAAMLWGTLPVIVQHVDAPPVALVAMRMGFGALGLGAGLAVRRRKVWMPAKLAGACALGALLAVNWVLFFTALRTLPGATATLINYVFPVLVAVVAPMVVRERREPHVLPCALAGFAGIAVILGPQAHTGRAYGAVLAIAAAFASTALVIGARAVVDAGVPGTVAAFWENLTGVVLLAPLAIGHIHGAAWAWGALIGFVHTGLAGWLFFKGIERLPAQEVGVLMYLEPVAAVLFVWAAVGAPPGLVVALGGLLVVGAGAAVVLLSRDHAGR